MPSSVNLVILLITWLLVSWSHIFVASMWCVMLFIILYNWKSVFAINNSVAYDNSEVILSVKWCQCRFIDLICAVFIFNATVFFINWVELIYYLWLMRCIKYYCTLYSSTVLHSSVCLFEMKIKMLLTFFLQITIHKNIKKTDCFFLKDKNVITIQCWWHRHDGNHAEQSCL